MKIKKLLRNRNVYSLALAVFAGVGCAIPAAQAEVTVYNGNGIIPSIKAYVRIDAGVRFVTNIDLPQYNGKTGTTTLVQGAGNDWGTSMFGVDGALPLSQDTKAIYKLETGFDATNGTFNGGSGMFNRRAYVGLSDTRFGTIMFGRDLFINNDIWGFDPTGQENMSTATLVYGRSWPGAADMVEYRSPDLAGLQVGLQASFDKSGASASTRLSDKWGASAQYTLGNLELLAIYDQIKSNDGYNNLYAASKEAIFGATYNLNPVKFYAGYQILSAPQAGEGDAGAVAVNSTVNTGATYQTYASVYATHAMMNWLGAVWTVTPKVTLRGAWYHTSLNDSAGHANLFTVGTEYYFRPNIFWYGTVGEVVNNGKAEFAADIGTPPPAPGHNQFAGYSGISVGF